MTIRFRPFRTFKTVVCFLVMWHFSYSLWVLLAGTLLCIEVEFKS